MISEEPQFARALRLWCAARGTTMAQLCSDLRIDEDDRWRWMVGASTPSPHEVRLIAGALGLEVAEFLEGP